MMYNYLKLYCLYINIEMDKVEDEKEYRFNYDEYEIVMLSLWEYKKKLEKCKDKDLDDLDEIKQVIALRSKLRRKCLNRQ